MTKKRSNESSEASANEALIEEVPVPVEAPPREAETVDEWRLAKRTPDWAFAAAKMLHGWPQGRVLSESDYDAAIRAAMTVRISGHLTHHIRRNRRK